MLFASTELAARIERAEVKLLDDCAAAIERSRPEADVLRAAIAGGIATYTGPDSPLNKLAGLGFVGPLDAGELAAIEHEFARRDAPVQAEIATLADPAVLATLVDRGYLLQGFENVLGRALSPDEAFAEPRDVMVAPGAPDDFDDWLDAVVTGFAHPDDQGVVAHESFPRDVLERVMRDMAAADGLQRWLARRGDELAGGASFKLTDGVAQLCGAATLPAHRRRGVQTALLHARLRSAAEAGCEVAVITTQPGSKSMQNARRQGFELLYARAVLVLPLRTS